MLCDHRFIEKGVSDGLTYLLLEEVVVEYQQAHWLHSANKFIQISIEECLLNAVGTVCSVDLLGISEFDSSFGQKLYIVVFFFMQFSALNCQIYLFSISFIQNGLGVSSNEH